MRDGSGPGRLHCHGQEVLGVGNPVLAPNFVETFVLVIQAQLHQLPPATQYRHSRFARTGRKRVCKLPAVKTC